MPRPLVFCSMSSSLCAIRSHRPGRCSAVVRVAIFRSMQSMINYLLVFPVVGAMVMGYVMVRRTLFCTCFVLHYVPDFSAFPHRVLL